MHLPYDAFSYICILVRCDFSRQRSWIVEEEKWILDPYSEGVKILKLIRHYEVVEFTFESKEEREEYVKFYENGDWVDSERMKKLKDGVSIMDATENDYEWYAHLTRRLK